MKKRFESDSRWLKLFCGLVLLWSICTPVSAALDEAEFWYINLANQPWVNGFWFELDPGLIWISSPADYPEVKDGVQIYYQRDVYVTNTQAIGHIKMWGNGGAELEIRNGGDLTVSSAGGQNGQIDLSGTGVGGPGGAVPNTGLIDIQTGGTLTSSNTGARTVITGVSAQSGSIDLNGGTFNASGGGIAQGLQILNADINLTSGTFTMTNGMLVPTGVDFNITGDQSTINLGILNVSGVYNADFNFTMDSDGISTVSATDWISLTNATIVVDGTSYTSGTGSFTLFDSSGSLTLPSTAPQANNFDGYEVSFSENSGDYIMSVTPTNLLTDPTITVPNYSFEDPVLASGGANASTPSWTRTGGGGTYHPNVAIFNSATPLSSPGHSNQVVYAESGTANPGTVTFESAESLGFVSKVYTYTLTVALGHSKLISPPREADDYMIEILLDGVPVASSTLSNAYSAIPIGTLQDLSTSFRATEAEHGKQLKVRLTHSSDDDTFRQGHFDNVRVTSTHTPWGTVITVQ